MKYIIIFLFCFSHAFGQRTSTGTIQPTVDTTHSFVFTTQWVNNLSLQLRDIAVCYDFFRARPGVLAVVKQKLKALVSPTDSSTITLDSVRIEVVVDLGNFIRRSAAHFPACFNRINAAIRTNSEINTYYNDRDDRELKACIMQLKTAITQ